MIYVAISPASIKLSRRVLVDHAYIVIGGEITKSAQLWFGHNLDCNHGFESALKKPMEKI
jgi:hypothetical protein